MTRVWMSPAVLDYCEGMAARVREVGQKPVITGVEPRRKELFPELRYPRALRLEGLLTPPRIEFIDPCLSPEEEQVEGIIQITASGEYGVSNVYVRLEDDQGNQIESGFALRDEVEEDDWFYFPSASFRSGASVTVRVTALDPLGGIGVEDETVEV